MIRPSSAPRLPTENRMSRSGLLLSSISIGCVAVAQPALAQEVAPAPAPVSSDSQSSVPATPGGAADATAPKSSDQIVIRGRRLDIARDAIAPSLGASQYTFNREALEKQPGRSNRVARYIQEIGR